MFQHLDDPVPLPASTHEQRQATLRRGESLRRRRRAKVFAATAAAAAAVAVFALSPTLRATTEVPPVAASPSPSVVATATVGPGRGSIALDGMVPESVTFTMPAGWEVNDGGWLFKSDNYGRTSLEGGMPFGFAFMDVANIYTDGCKWRLVDPAPGPTVNDLVAAYANVPGFGGNTSDITVDGFPGKLVEYNIPGYNADDCREGRFAMFKEDGTFGDTPTIMAQAPLQENQIRILDVSGSRLVILTGYPSDISPDERTELDTIINSIHIE